MLNTERIASRQAFLVAVGTAAVHSDRDLPLGFFDGMAATPREAQMLAYRINSERRKRRNQAKAVRGLPGVLGA